MSLGYFSSGSVKPTCGFQDYSKKKSEVIIDVAIKVGVPVLTTALSVFAIYLINKKKSKTENKNETMDHLINKVKERHGWTENSSSTKNEERINGIEIEDQPYLLFNSFIHKGEIVCFVADAKVGKTLLMAYLARNVHPLKTAVFMFDDQGGLQQPRFRDIPNLEYFGRAEMKELLDEMENDADSICGNRALLDLVIKNSARFQDRKKKLLKEVSNRYQNKIDNILLFELLVECRCKDSDIIVVDSLTSLVNDDFSICRPVIERIMSFCRMKGKTLILLHHLNKKGDFAGHSSLKRTVDLMLFMDKISENLLKIRAAYVRFTTGREECYVKKVKVDNNKANFEVCENDPSPSLQNGKKSVRKIILDVLGTNDDISFSSLQSFLVSYDLGSIQNALRKLEIAGHIAKADGKTWKVIKNLKSGDILA